jgi:hypothetical protein
VVDREDEVEKNEAVCKRLSKKWGSSLADCFG